MKIGTLTAIAFSTLVCGCGALTKVAQHNAPITPEKMGYSDEAKTMFYYTEGVKAMSFFGDMQQAAMLFSAAIDGDSSFAPAYHHLSMVYERSSHLAKALELSLKANALDSSNLWFKGQLGQTYVKNGEYGKALNVYDELVKMEPTNPSNHRILAALYQQQGQPFSAISILDSAEYRLGRQPELSDYKRELLLSVNMHDRAIQETESLISDFPDNYESYLALSQMYVHAKRDSMALTNLLKARDLNPNGVDVLMALNDFYKEREDVNNFMNTTRQLFDHRGVELEDKISFFETLTSDREFYGRNIFRIDELASILIAMYPNDMKVVKLFTQNQIAQGKLENALVTYKSYVRPDSTHKDIYTTIVDIETYLKRADSVYKYSRMAIAAYPTDCDLYLRQGGSLSYLKRNKEAQEAYNTAYKLASTDSLRSVIIGTIGDMEYNSNGSTKKAYANYNKALKLDPNNVMVLNNYAYFLSEENRELDKALMMIEKVVELEPGNPTYLDSHAWILHKMGDNQRAKKIIQQAISLDRNNNSELLLHYGDILHALGEDFMAKIYWRKALEAGHDAAEIEKRISTIK